MRKSEKYFYLSDGNVLKSVEEFALKLDEISDEVYYSHVTDEKNDFANWVEGVFKDKEAVEIIKNTKDKKELQLKLLKLVVKRVIKPKRRYVCKICGRKFDKKVALSVHMAVAHNKKRGDK